MVEASADVTLPVSPEEAFAVVADVAHADWLPAVRGVRHISGPPTGLEARYAVEVGLVGRHLAGVLVCREYQPSSRLLLVLEEGLDLQIAAVIQPLKGGAQLTLTARYSVGRGPLAVAAERASQAPARREVARALEQLSAHFARKAAAAPPEA